MATQEETIQTILTKVSTLATGATTSDKLADLVEGAKYAIHSKSFPSLTASQKSAKQAILDKSQTLLNSESDLSKFAYLNKALDNYLFKSLDGSDFSITDLTSPMGAIYDEVNDCWYNIGNNIPVVQMQRRRVVCTGNPMFGGDVYRYLDPNNSALFEDGTKIAIECDGDKWHGSEQYLNDLMRQKVLERCGWQFVRIRGYEYYTNREKALEPLWNMIKITDSQSLITNNLIELSNEPNIVIQIEEETIEKEYEEIEINNDLIEESEVFSHPMILEKNLSSLFNHVHVKKFDKSHTIQNNDEIVRYFHLFKSGDYILNLDNSSEADYIIPIYSVHKNGYLLQFYESGHINKVRVSSLLSKKLEKKYMNGLNLNDTLNKITLIESESIIGICFDEKGERKFKAHLSEKISVRDQLQLQGYKVIYNEFKNIEYTIFPLTVFDDIHKLIFNSFTANGKSFNNTYYSKEWTLIKNYVKSTEAKQTKTKKEIDILSNSFNNTLFDNRVKLNSIVKLKYYISNRIIIVQIVDFQVENYNRKNGIQMINLNSPLAKFIIGKSVGDIVNIGETKTKVEIIEIV